MTKDNDNIILFPQNRIVEKNKTGPTEKNEEFSKALAREQTVKFIETAVDDMSIELLRKFYNMAIKTNKDSFTRDLALLVDMMRGLIYRDFNEKHPAQTLSDKMVTLKKNKDGVSSAAIDYSKVLNKKHKQHKPLSPDIKDEIKDVNDQAGLLFDGEDLNDD